MIYKASTDPILLKKIYLRTWTLKDHMSALIEEMITKKGDLSIKEIKEHLDNYLDNSFLVDSKASFLTGEDLDKFLRALKDMGINPANLEEETLKKLIPDFTSIRPEIPVDCKAKASVFLSDLKFDSLSFFNGLPLIVGQNIFVEFIVPNNFVISAEVTDCRHYGINSKVISDHRRPYQIKAKLTYLREGEKMFWRKFLESISNVTKGESGKEKTATAATATTSEEEIKLDSLDL